MVDGDELVRKPAISGHLACSVKSACGGLVYSSMTV
jgi:hypothetical protein